MCAHYYLEENILWQMHGYKMLLILFGMGAGVKNYPKPELFTVLNLVLHVFWKFQVIFFFWLLSHVTDISHISLSHINSIFWIKMVLMVVIEFWMFAYFLMRNYFGYILLIYDVTTWLWRHYGLTQKMLTSAQNLLIMQ